MNNYRHLTETEISALEGNGCVAENWQDVKVSDKFDPRLLLRVCFSGHIRIGANVRIADSVIENYEIGENSSIIKVGKIFTEGKSSFGIGTAVPVLNEAGGREVLLHTGLSAQIAYMEAMCRHRPALIEVLQRLTLAEAEAGASVYGTIGANVCIRNVGTVKNVRIGDNVVLEDCLRLENGTITGGQEAKGTYLGAGIICRNFVIQDGAEIDDGVKVETAFIGQGVKLSKGFSAANSLFFANSHCENGEAAAVFAGPYTVSHHKSTLLIGGMYSYTNAGSNTNFSNHLYKLGPLHHGVFGRGVKFGSGSYMMLPARIGAYSTVIGKHYSHPDTSWLPFSYVLETEDGTCVIPGINLTGVGLFRDIDKWQSRDRRKGNQRFDILNNASMTPYSASKAMEGMGKLGEILAGQQFSGQHIESEGFYMEASSVSKGITRYENAMVYYIGLRMLERLKGGKYQSDEILRSALVPETSEGTGKWVDAGGLIAPLEEVDTLSRAIESGEIQNFAGIIKRLASINENYPIYEWSWLYSKFKDIFNIDPIKITKKRLLAIIVRWKEVGNAICDSIVADASKEFSDTMRVGFGVDGDENVSLADFSSVRGCLEDYPVFKQIEHLRQDMGELADSVALSL